MIIYVENFTGTTNNSKIILYNFKVHNSIENPVEDLQPTLIIWS